MHLISLAALFGLPVAALAAPAPVATAAPAMGIVRLPVDPINVDLSSDHLEKRATACTKAADCNGIPHPFAAHNICSSSKVCTWVCNSGYTKRAGKCFMNTGGVSATTASASTLRPTYSLVTTIATTTTTTTPRATATDWLVNAEIAKRNITGFKAATLGTNTNAIASWFNTNSTIDSTNGNSWCYFPYDNTVPGLAISLKQMLANFPDDPTGFKVRDAYCGLELLATNPVNGAQVTLFVVDAFDDAWVLTPTSVDIIQGSFAKLYGSVTSNKNDVVKNASWKFTGRRNYKYKFQGRGSS